MLEDKIAIVTGGGTGIGKTIGLQMAKNRAKVAIASRSRSHLVKRRPSRLAGRAIQELQIQGRRNKVDIQRGVTEIVAQWGAIHILVTMPASRV
jgi:fengycin family lipopeptide synthetase B